MDRVPATQAETPERRPARKYNIFISWSGEVSQRLAAALHGWIPDVLQAAVPYMSDADIEAGSRWFDEIATHLSSIHTGLICVTPDNQYAPWLNFEAGALSNQVDRPHVVPLLWKLEKSELRYPLAAFNAKSFTKEDLRAVLTTINNKLHQPIQSNRLANALTLNWPDLEQQLRSIEESSDSSIDPARSSSDMLQELIVSSREQLDLMRSLHEKRNQDYSDFRMQMRPVVQALRKLGDMYKGPDQLLTISDTLRLAPRFDAEDWKIVKSAPFLLWYLTELHGIVPKPNSDPQEVPF